MSEFGDNLRETRVKKEWTQGELADKMNLTQASISQFEKGQRLPTPANITKFAEVLGVSRESFAGKSEGKFEKELLMRNIKSLSPESLRKINEYVDFIKSKEE